MDSVSTYSVASLAWLATQAIPLIIWPSLISTLLQVDSPPQQGAQYGAAYGSLEQYFARSLGLAQLALGSLLLILSGALPLDSVADQATPATTTATPTGSASAAVLVTALYHAATASYAYARYAGTGGRQFAYLCGCLGGSGLAAFGLWVLLFAGDANRRVSRRTGADKSTSGWPFRNAEADKKRGKGGARRRD
ncbi:predicted protein [Chaetomium globosum CBS 148.51]|uniref:Uncharacterized protein n=1 Tax=Chaetomium globosum (strain ATCC 6205 / CBS 148.51 / DSM 1962 / NBRC 6347 / NRRL 1970) TaxID=306901 RepID=Q2HEF0_CHAGB|nr:uncharacterized protein CHGG_01404 [Chaetomium globosum CBS 148.51]EAQ93169.1 predicted protein [Chaetomium globosum CBS 148.51]